MVELFRARHPRRTDRLADCERLLAAGDHLRVGAAVVSGAHHPEPPDEGWLNKGLTDPAAALPVDDRDPAGIPHSTKSVILEERPQRRSSHSSCSRSRRSSSTSMELK